jgi:hypothetical protein
MLRAVATGLLLATLTAATGWADDEPEIGRFQVFDGHYGVGTEPQKATFMVDTTTGQSWVLMRGDPYMAWIAVPFEWLNEFDALPTLATE